MVQSAREGLLILGGTFCFYGVDLKGNQKENHKFWGPPHFEAHTRTDFCQVRAEATLRPGLPIKSPSSVAVKRAQQSHLHQ